MFNVILYTEPPVGIQLLYIGITFSILNGIQFAPCFEVHIANKIFI